MHREIEGFNDKIKFFSVMITSITYWSNKFLKWCHISMLRLYKTFKKCGTCEVKFFATFCMTNWHLWESKGYRSKCMEHIIFAYDIARSWNSPFKTSYFRVLLPAIPGLSGSFKYPPYKCISGYLLSATKGNISSLTSSSGFQTQNSGSQNWLPSVHTTWLDRHSVFLLRLASMNLSSFHLVNML